MVRRSRLQEAFIQEASRKDILKRADSGSRGRSKPLTSRLTGMKGNVLTFQTVSGTDPAKFWIQRVQPFRLAKALEKLWDGSDKRVLPAIRKALTDDLNVSCNCPAFKWWGYAFISSKDGFKMGGRQGRFPHIRNPKLRGSVCKHLINVLQVLPFQAPKITSLFKKEQGL